MNSAPVLRLEKVSRDYGSAAGAIPVLRDVDLEVAAGQSLAITGPSGSGKSTLLNLMGTLDRPTAGRLFLEGRETAGRSERELCALRNRLIGFVFQFHHLLPQFTVLENVLIPAAIVRPRDPLVPDRARRLLARVGLERRLTHRPGELSGGERQRVAVVRALINRPGLLLADEPSGSLDRVGSENLAELLAELHREEKLTLIIVTHSELLARHMERIFVLRDGRLEAAR
jgi:lipoprotein-releasing system ATP-binding protein